MNQKRFALLKKFLTDRATVVAVVAFMALSIVFAPTLISRADFSIDATSLLDSASAIFNGLWPAFALVAGIALGTGLVAKIVSEIRKAF